MVSLEHGLYQDFVDLHKPQVTAAYSMGLLKLGFRKGHDSLPTLDGGGSGAIVVLTLCCSITKTNSGLR